MKLNIKLTLLDHLTGISYSICLLVAIMKDEWFAALGFSFAVFWFVLYKVKRQPLEKFLSQFTEVKVTTEDAEEVKNENEK